jgi:hypothetical protein
MVKALMKLLYFPAHARRMSQYGMVAGLLGQESAERCGMLTSCVVLAEAGAEWQAIARRSYE